jgi:hypothetical protein
MSDGMMGGDMMSMMGPGGMGEMMMPGMDMADRVEGRIAFLKTELKITDAQDKMWNEFTQSLRGNANTLGGMRAMMGAPDAQTMPQRLEAQQKWYAARADGIKALAAATTKLYAALSDDQKKTGDQILPPHLGLMPMRGMGMMGQVMMGQGMMMPRGGPDSRMGNGMMGPPSAPKN